MQDPLLMENMNYWELRVPSDSTGHDQELFIPFAILQFGHAITPDFYNYYTS